MEAGIVGSGGPNLMHHRRMSSWTAFAYDASAYTFDAATLPRHWDRLHAGDAEPLPTDPQVLAAWALFHAGRFQPAVAAGLAAAENGARAGVTVANKAQAVYANYLEPSEKTRLALFMEVAERAEGQIAVDSKNANAHYLMAYGLSRYSQGISIAKALAQGLGSKIKLALETAIKLSPQHADAHVALGGFHAEVIDKVGSLLGRTQGASKDAGLAMFRTALKLNPNSAIAMVEYANGLVMLEGESRIKDATRLYEQAALCEPQDATEKLDIEMAKAQLED
jgi:tetratricopeptide (TPR) repeat protein